LLRFCFSKLQGFTSARFWAVGPGLSIPRVGRGVNASLFWTAPERQTVQISGPVDNQNAVQSTTLCYRPDGLFDLILANGKILMKRVQRILRKFEPNSTFPSTDFIADGWLDSFDMVTLVAHWIRRRISIQERHLPENFKNLETIPGCCVLRRCKYEVHFFSGNAFPHPYRVRYEQPSWMRCGTLIFPKALALKAQGGDGDTTNGGWSLKEFVFPISRCLA